MCVRACVCDIAADWLSLNLKTSENVRVNTMNLEEREETRCFLSLQPPHHQTLLLLFQEDEWHTHTHTDLTVLCVCVFLKSHFSFTEFLTFLSGSSSCSHSNTMKNTAGFMMHIFSLLHSEAQTPFYFADESYFEFKRVKNWVRWKCCNKCADNLIIYRL